MRLRALTLCGAALLVVGCSTTMEGSPTVSSTEPSALFNPCDIPDDALRAAGVDPGTEKVGIAGTGFEGWEICSWEAEWYFLGVLTSHNTFDDLRRNSELANFRDVAAGSREGFTAVNVGRDDSTCNFGFAVEGGTVVVNMATKYLISKPEEPCETVVKRVEDLDTQLPR
ncbi:DUF3558 domain-containing protein [Antrihabitans spumae]|uniref:DUF3558 domain-containing protein n=1 Tax=Antrihabitans spumae TaxID=3373370 RepID=A0ABW7KN91_9NOCA